MLPRLFFAILLGFPLLELLVSSIVAYYIGWWLLLWFGVAAVIGILLIRERQFFLVGNLMLALQRGESPVQALFASGRLMLAAVLLVLPGVLSDVLALFILLWPRRRFPPAANDALVGEFKRE